jgi:deoxycytidylate deaminase
MPRIDGAAPPDWAIEAAEQVAVKSPCAKSKRGVSLYSSHDLFGSGFNGPPLNAACPGRERCGDRCGRLCVHAEMRAIRGVQHPGHELHLVHVKLGAGGRVTAGGPPSCWQCSREILDVGFVTGVWLYEEDVRRCLSCKRFEDSSARYADRTKHCHECGAGLTSFGAWRYYAAADFHSATLRNAGLSKSEQLLDELEALVEQLRVVRRGLGERLAIAETDVERLQAEVDAAIARHSRDLEANVRLMQSRNRELEERRQALLACDQHLETIRAEHAEELRAKERELLATRLEVESLRSQLAGK